MTSCWADVLSSQCACLSVSLLGLIPYNFICVQMGAMLSEVSSLDDLFSWARLLQLLSIACVALVPGALIRRYHQHRLNLDGSQHNGTAMDKLKTQ